MNYKTELQSNNVDLQSILNIINSLPNAGGSSGTAIGGYILRKALTTTMNDIGELDISEMTQSGDVSIIIAISSDWSFTALWNNDSGYCDYIADSSYLIGQLQIQDNQDWSLDTGFYKFASGETFYLLGFGN